jgi:hypothetical protein
VQFKSLTHLFVQIAINDTRRGGLEFMISIFIFLIFVSIRDQRFALRGLNQ